MKEEKAEGERKQKEKGSRRRKEAAKKDGCTRNGSSASKLVF